MPILTVVPRHENALVSSTNGVIACTDCGHNVQCSIELGAYITYSTVVCASCLRQRDQAYEAWALEDLIAA